MALKVMKSAEVTKRFIKILYYGEYGSGKTVAALTYPRVFAIDTENRISAYAGHDIQEQFGLQPFDFVLAQTIPDLKEAIGIFQADKGHNYTTLVVDSISSFFYDSYARWAAKLEGTSENVYTRVNAEMRTIMGLFASVNANIVMTARVTDKYKSTGKYFQSVGEKADSDKSIGYAFDYIVKTNKDTHAGLLDKQTGYQITKTPAQPIKNIGYQCFAPAIEVYQNGQGDTLVERTPEQIIAANEHHDQVKNRKDSFTDRKETQEFCVYWMSRSQGSAQEMIEYLNSQLGTTAKGFSEFKIKISEAHTILEKAFPEVSEIN